jgi:hypothetical protein
MPKPDSNQKALAGEYYISSLLSRMGYSVALTIGNAKSIDLVATADDAEAVNFQVKTTETGYDWLVRGRFPERKDLLIAFVRLGGPLYQRPEAYILTPGEANGLLDERYTKHSPRVRRTAVRETRGDHDLSLVVRKLGS